MRDIQQKQRSSHRNHSTGMSLIELLVVVTIVVVLMALAVPLMRPAISEGYVREASRQINAYVAGARARAAQTEREVGIRFQRLAPGSDAAIDVFIVEAPPPYSGDLFDAKAQFVDPPASEPIRFATFNNASASLPLLVKVGDFIRFDYRGAYYEIKQVITGSPITIEFRSFSSAYNMGSDGKGGCPDTDDDGDGVKDEAITFPLGQDQFI